MLLCLPCKVEKGKESKKLYSRLSLSDALKAGFWEKDTEKTMARAGNTVMGLDSSRSFEYVRFDVMSLWGDNNMEGKMRKKDEREVGRRTVIR